MSGEIGDELSPEEAAAWDAVMEARQEMLHLEDAVTEAEKSLARLRVAYDAMRQTYLDAVKVLRKAQGVPNDHP